MKCSMDHNGCITIVAENPTETFALAQWAKMAIFNQADKTWVKGEYLIVQPKTPEPWVIHPIGDRP